MNREKSLLHVSFMMVATLLVFWTARATIPLWIVVPALAVVIAGPWLQRRRLTWEAIIAVALASVLATNGQRLTIGLCGTLPGVLLPSRTDALLCRRCPHQAEGPWRTGLPLQHRLAGTAGHAGRRRALPFRSPCCPSSSFWHLLLAGTDEDRPSVSAAAGAGCRHPDCRHSPGNVPSRRDWSVQRVDCPEACRTSCLAVPRHVDFITRRHTTNWWKPWPAAATSLLGSWLMRTALAEELHVLALSLLVAPLVMLLAWIFIGAVLQQGPGKSLRKTSARSLPAVRHGLRFRGSCQHAQQGTEYPDVRSFLTLDHRWQASGATYMADVPCTQAEGQPLPIFHRHRAAARGAEPVDPDGALLRRHSASGKPSRPSGTALRVLGADATASSSNAPSRGSAVWMTKSCCATRAGPSSRSSTWPRTHSIHSTSRWYAEKRRQN